MEWMNSGWFWWGMALALFALEALLPGAFMLWLGFAALASGLLQLLWSELSSLMQWVMFSVFSLIAMAAGWRYRSTHAPAETDQPMLNRRTAHLLDRVYPLDEAISNGRGRVKIGDAYWVVSGEDLPAGTRVRVVAIDGISLRVHPAE